MQRQLLTIGGGLFAVFLTIALLESGASAIQGRQGQETIAPDFSLETPDLDDVPTIGEEDAGTVAPDPSDETPPAENAVRSIANPQFGPPDTVQQQPLERVEPRQPLSLPPSTPTTTSAVLRRPVAVSAGLVEFEDGRRIQFDGLAPQMADRTCDDDGKTWPCGEVARTAFRNFLRARALVCDVPKSSWQGTVTARCTVGGDNPAAWLARNGWAEASAGSQLAETIDAARHAGLGFSGPDPRELETAPDIGTFDVTPDVSGAADSPPDL